MKNISKSLLLIIFALLGCDSNRPYEGKLNPELLDKYELSSAKFNHPVLLNPLKIFRSQRYLFILEDRRIPPDKPLIHIFDKEDLEYKSSKGKIGFGPFEIPSADVFHTFNSKEEFLVYSGMDKKFVKYDLKDSSLLGLDEFKMPPSNTPLGLFYFLPDSTFIGMSTFDENKFVEVDFSGQKMAGYGNWEIVQGKEDLSYFHHFVLNNGWFKTDDSYNIFVNASIFRDRLEIFNRQNKEIITIDGSSEELPPFEYYNENMPLNIPISNPFRYRDVYISENKIYALYGGLTEEHYRETGELALRIFIFTKKGVPLYEVKLDRSIKSMVVDEELGKLYGLTTDEDPGIAIFDLPEELR